MRTFREIAENELNKTDGSEFEASDYSKAKAISAYKGNDLLQDKDKFFLMKDDKIRAELWNYDNKISRKTINIVSALSHERGAYKDLLMALLNNKKVNKIISDSTISLPAEKFWRKICKDDSIKKIAVDIDDNEIDIKSSEEAIKYLEDPDYRVGLKK